MPPKLNTLSNLPVVLIDLNQLLISMNQSIFHYEHPDFKKIEI